MTQPLSDQVQSIIESICETGCNNVNQIIDQLETGQPTQETEHLTEAERQQVLHELKNIMSVYKNNI